MSRRGMAVEAGRFTEWCVEPSPGMSVMVRLVSVGELCCGIAGIGQDWQSRSVTERCDRASFVLGVMAAGVSNGAARFGADWWG